MHNAVHDTNVGNHSNFSDMKNVGSYDTLTEANVAGAATWTTPGRVRSECSNVYRTIDGDTGTYWNHNSDEAHWIVFDMGSSVTVTQVQLCQDATSGNRWPNGDGTALVDVYVSDSPTSWGTVDLNDWDANNAAGWQTSGAFSATGRYVILQMTSSSGNAQNARMYEFNAMVSSSWTKPVSVKSECQYGNSFGNTIDGNTGTYWLHDTNEQHWIVFDMGQSVIVTQVRIFEATDSAERWGAGTVNVYVSDSPTSWGSVDHNWNPKGAGSGWQASGTFNATGRYVILQATSSSNSDNDRMYEFQAMVTPPANYRLDLEVQFTGVTPYTQYTQLEIQTGAFSGPAEAIYVDYWTGSAWSNLGTLAPSTLNIFSVSLGGTGYELRFVDGTTTGDTTQSTWQIDFVRLVAP